MADLAPVAKAAAQQVRDRLAVLAILRLILAHDSGYVDRTILPSHTIILPHPLIGSHVLSWLHFTTPKKPSVLLRRRIGRIYGLNFGVTIQVPAA